MSNFRFGWRKIHLTNFHVATTENFYFEKNETRKTKKIDGNAKVRDQNGRIKESKI